MPRLGGDSDKLGNQYEAVWTVKAVLDVFEDTYRSITVEAHGVDSVGVEFRLEQFDGTLHFHSVKRQKQGGDWSVADLCRSDKSTGRSILGDLIDKLEAHSSSKICFVSATGANRLRELSERAALADSVSHFRAGLSDNLTAEFGRIEELCRNKKTDAFVALKSLKVALYGHSELVQSVHQRIAGLFYRIEGLPIDSGEVRRLIAEFVINRLGLRNEKEQVWTLLDDNGYGLRDWKRDPTTRDAVAAANKRYRNMAGSELINGSQIARGAVDEIADSLDDPQSRGALLVAPGGYGKSCVLAQFVSRLIERNIPHLCLRMDDSFQPCITSKRLGEQMGLGASPAVVLAGVADNTPCVLVVDQLDAMSLVSGRSTGMHGVFREMCDEARAYPRMKLVLACRDYDLTHDHRLNALNKPESEFKRVDLHKLTASEIRSSLDLAGLPQVTLDSKQIDILGVPFHLLLFLQGDPTRSFSSVGELYGGYWNRKRQNLKERLGRDSKWDLIVDALTQSMSEGQATVAPAIVVDEWLEDARAMVSEHVLVELPDHNSYRFFHESFFDYAYARRFCTRGRGVVEFLTTTEQHLFRRAQVRQILAYRRVYDFRQYVRDLREVLATDQVRFHIKRMVASGLSQLDGPTIEEWEVVEPYLLSGELSRSISNALRDHAGWFDRMDSLGVFQKWMACEDPALNNAAIWFLESRRLHAQRSSRIAALIAPYINRNEIVWQRRIGRIFSWGIAHKSPEMGAHYLGFIAQGSFDDENDDTPHIGDFWTHLHDAEREAPRFVIEVLGTWFDRFVAQLEPEMTRYAFFASRRNHSHSGIIVVARVAAAEPAYFLEQMLPRSISAILRNVDDRGGDMRNRIWPLLSNATAPTTVLDAVLMGLRRSLETSAKCYIDTFRRHTGSMTCYADRTLGYLLLRAWSNNPSIFADECAAYMANDQRRLNIGYDSVLNAGEGRGESAISRIALRAISPYCSDDHFRTLELRIVGYCDNYEKRTPRWRGFSELLVLRSLERNRLSKEAALRIEELERKFPNLTDEIVTEDHSSMARFVGSPITEQTCELMTDANWISAMRKYDGSESPFDGGFRQLSQILIECARRDRLRFSSLAVQMPDDIKPIYFSAILDGLTGLWNYPSEAEKAADKARIAATPTGVFLAVVERMHALPGRPCGLSIVRSVAKLADRPLPSRLLEFVSYYAMSDEDPTSDVWQERVNGQAFYDGDPHSHGINTVRGEAARAISALLFADYERKSAFRLSLDSLAEDPVVSVRACAIEAFLPILISDRDLAVELFLRACSGRVAICTTDPFERFIGDAKFTHFERIRGVFVIALDSDLPKAVEIASRQIILAELEGLDVGDLPSRVRSGNEMMRHAAAHVYATNISNSTVGSECARRLEEFFDDKSEAVRKVVGIAFFQISGERILQLSDFIDRFIESRSFETDAYRLLHALSESNVELPQVVCRAAERILNSLESDSSEVPERYSVVGQSISSLVVRQYEQSKDGAIKSRCLGLIDRMELNGFLGIAGELERIDR